MAARRPSAKATGWVLATVMVALLLSAGAWFFAISPVRDEAAAAQEQAQATLDSNALLEVRIARLAEQFTHIEEYRAELASLRTQIPTDGELDSYLRQIQELALASQVTVTTVAANTAVSVTVPQPVVAPAATPETSPEGSTEEGAATDPAAADGAAADESAAAVATAPVTVVPQGFVAVPITLTVVGPYEGVVSFIGQMQQGTQRLFLVTALSGTGQEEAEASGGRPATAAGDLELSLTGYTYVLLDPAVAPIVPAAEAPEVPLPAAVPGKNPLARVGTSGS